MSTGTSTTRDVTYEYDGLNRVTKSTLNGNYTTYQYDKVGNMTKQTMAKGTQPVTYSYDQLNRSKIIIKGIELILMQKELKIMHKS